MKQTLCTVTSNVEISPGVRLMWVEAPDIAIAAQPGQFVTVCCEDFILRRPLSIHQVVIGGNVIAVSRSPERSEGEANQSQLAILFKVVGRGTLWLSQRQAGDKIDILGPLGEGFDIPSVIARHEVPRQSRNLLLVAGGIGIAPLIFLAQYASSQHSIILIHGASTARELYPFSSLRTLRSPCHTERVSRSPERSEGEESRGAQDKLREESHPSGQAPQSNFLPLTNKVRFIPVTEDGSMGEKGMVTDILPGFLDWADQIYACGPVEMYKAMSNLSCHSERSEESKLKKCQISLEVRLGCGIGACYGCTINTKRGLKRVCRDGPVFELDDILWEEVII